MKKSGFYLLEVAFYLALFSVCCLGVCHLVHHTCTTFVTLQKNNKIIIDAYLTLDMLRRDIWSSAQEAHLWDMNNSVFTRKYLDSTTSTTLLKQDAVGWSLRNSTLYRSVGKYDFAQRTWISSGSAKCIDNVANFIFKPVKNHMTGLIEYVTIRFDIPSGSAFNTLSHSIRENIYVQNRSITLGNE